MLVFLNPAAGGGRAMNRWERVAPRIAGTHEMLVHVLENQADALQVLIDAVGRGERKIVAAGGDGTVNAVLTMLMHERMRDALDRVTLGAIGLGSSNDFHKPPGSTVEDCPCKLDFAQARLRDVGMLATGIDGTGVYRYFLSNASIGATADANREFNEPDRLLCELKHFSTPTAILYAALKTIARHRNIAAVVTSPETGTLHIRLSNLGVVKNNHFSGNLRYDSPARLDDGLLGVHLCHGMSSPELAQVLFALSTGRFNGMRKTRSWSSSSLSVLTTLPINVEFDGEIITTRSVRFTALHNAIKVCP
ncbi:MAG: diacylglycerol kinase [Bacteroidetes bacterium]|nr:diacylglycerol kinase [Bacteroidota bacterium]